MLYTKYSKKKHKTWSDGILALERRTAYLKDLLTGLVKSISFAWIITIIAVHRGLNFSGGATGVGAATTASVVSSLFGIIVLDAFWGLIFYLKW